MTIATISPQLLQNRVQAGEAVELIDVRTAAEFRELHVPFARNVPLDQLDAGQLVASRKGAKQPLYVICQAGRRGEQACAKLAAAGDTRVINVEGGTKAWEQAGLPVVRGQKSMSLERQVRIAAGSLVVLGIALGAFAHPYFLGLSGFVGAGLVFAGITDTCGMAMILARMPWNQVAKTNNEGAACSIKPKVA